MTEAQIQSECVRWFWNTYPEHRRMLFHVDNNSWNAIIGAQKKALGVVKGVSDLVLVLDGCVMFLEFKDETGVQKVEQEDFECKVKDRGHAYRVFRSVEQFKQIIWQTIGK